MREANYLIQELDTSNYKLLVPLMNDTFGMKVNENYFKWKYFDNPAGNCIGYLAIEKKTNTCISFYGAMPQKFIVKGKETTLYQTCDTMTDTRHRKKGLFPILARDCFNAIKDRDNYFLFGIGGSELTFPVLNHFGWRTISRFRNYFKPGLFCVFSSVKKYRDEYFCVEQSLDSIRSLIENKPPSHRVHALGNVVHYKWRISNPNFNYQVVSYKKNNAPKGFVVYYIDGNKIVLFDFVFQDGKARKALLWYLSKLVFKKKYKGIIFFCQENGPKGKQLRKNSFITNPFSKGPLSDKPPFMICAEEGVLQEFMDPEKWELTAYDYDAL